MPYLNGTKALLDDANTAKQYFDLPSVELLTKTAWNTAFAGSNMPVLSVSNLDRAWFLTDHGGYVMDVNGQVWCNVLSDLFAIKESMGWTTVPSLAWQYIPPVAIKFASAVGFLVFFKVNRDIWAVLLSDINSFRVTVSRCRKIGTFPLGEYDIFSTNGVKIGNSHVNTYSWEYISGNVIVDVVLNPYKISSDADRHSGLIRILVSANSLTIASAAGVALTSPGGNIFYAPHTEAAAMKTSAHAYLGDGKQEYFFLTGIGSGNTAPYQRRTLTTSQSNPVLFIHPSYTSDPSFETIASNVSYDETQDSFLFIEKNQFTLNLVLYPSTTRNGDVKTVSLITPSFTSKFESFRSPEPTSTGMIWNRTDLYFSSVNVRSAQISSEKSGSDTLIYIMMDYYNATTSPAVFDPRVGASFSIYESAVPSGTRYRIFMKWKCSSDGTLSEEATAVYYDAAYGVAIRGSNYGVSPLFSMDGSTIITSLGQVNSWDCGEVCPRFSTLFGRADTNTYPGYPVPPTRINVSQQIKTYLCSINKSDLSLRNVFSVSNDSPSLPAAPTVDAAVVLSGEGIIMGDKWTSTAARVSHYKFSEIDEESESSSSSSDSIGNISESSSSSSESVNNISESSSSSSVSESSSSVIAEPLYDPQIVYVILADQSGHHNLLPFSFSTDNRAFHANTSSVPFTFSNASALDYSGIYASNGITTATFAQYGQTYVPQPDEAKYIHTSEIYVDIIASNSDSIASTFVSSMENGLHIIDPNDTFVIPKFTWDIKIISIPESSNVYGSTLTDSGGA